MLQWMGGSRRKVTASRKSVQKRQKQYFEQRRRQQHQLAAGLESSEGERNKWEQSHKEHQSLDILNLRDVSSSQDCMRGYPNGREQPEDSASTAKYHINTDAQIIEASMDIPAHSIEIKRASSLPDCQAETLSSKKFQLSSLDNHRNSFSGVDNKPDLCNTATQQQVWFFDLLGDSEPNEYVEAGPTHEAHVAFSVDGLGKVGTDTPPESPQQPDSFSPLKAATRLNSSRNRNCVLNDLEIEVDAMMQDLEMPLSSISLDFSTGIEDLYSTLKKTSAGVRDHMQHDGQGSKVRSSFSHGKAFRNNRNTYEDVCGVPARSSLLVAEFLDEKQSDMSWKNCSFHSDGDSSEFLKYGKPNYAFGGSCFLKKRDATEVTERFNSLDLPSIKHRKSENDNDFMTSKGVRHHLVVTNVNLEDLTGHPDWPSFVLEDPRESLGCLSEESCSSTAVRAEASGMTPNK